MVANYGEFLEHLFLPVLRGLMILEQILQWLPWYVTIVLVTGITLAASRNWKTRSLPQ